MNKDVNALIADRINKAEEAFDLAKLAIEKSYWISATNRLYYTCFYLITALYAKYNIRTHTHAGVKAVFASQFIREGLIDAKWGKMLNKLFNTRQIGDYGDFAVLTAEDILPMLKDVEEFRVMMLKMLEN